MVISAPPTDKLVVNGSVRVGNRLFVEGSDLVLGSKDGRNQGNISFNRALVHGDNDELIINYDGDFEGGVRLLGKGLACKEVCVTPNAGWCDYVFDSQYKLMPISELNTYVSINKHLPEIPAANEIITNGIPVSEILTLQMKKIEELTLYIISLQNQLNQLTKK